MAAVLGFGTAAVARWVGSAVISLTTPVGRYVGTLTDDGRGVSERKCGLAMPHLLTATRLRGYSDATLQLLALTESDIEALTRHMSHDAQVHR